MNEEELKELLERLVKLPQESEWVEFKANFHSPEEIGERISALSNGACLHNHEHGYLVFGVEDKLQTIEGTSFKPHSKKVKGQELESWILLKLSPRLDYRIYEFKYGEKPIVIFEIPAAGYQPLRFDKQAYIRVGSYTKKLNEFPEKEANIWNKKTLKVFEKELAKSRLTADEVVQLLDTHSYYALLKQPYPTTREAVLEKFHKEKFIKKSGSTKFSITNMGALLFARDFKEFDHLANKSIRVIIYKGRNKVQTEREQIGVKGYAVGFAGLIDWINGHLPANEEIGKAFRKAARMYPEIAIRELVANAIIHQDFREIGSPMVEIFTDRIEFTNPGIPLITTNRFIDEFQTRNEDLASFMRRIGICEEKGSGIDKVVYYAQEYQLPAPDFQRKEKHTTAIMYSYKDLNDMDKNDKIRAAYQHACLCFISNDKMTNKSLRERFKIEEKNASTASRIIKDALDAGVIKYDDPDSKSRRFVKYVPSWA